MKQEEREAYVLKIVQLIRDSAPGQRAEIAEKLLQSEQGRDSNYKAFADKLIEIASRRR